MQSLDPRLMITLIRPVLNRRGSEEPIKDYKLISKAGRTKTLDATLIRISCFKYSMDLCQPCSELIQWIASPDLRDSVFDFERNLSRKTCYLYNELVLYYLRLSREEERNGNYVSALFGARRICDATEDTGNLVCAVSLSSRGALNEGYYFAWADEHEIIAWADEGAFLPTIIVSNYQLLKETCRYPCLRQIRYPTPITSTRGL